MPTSSQRLSPVRRSEEPPPTPLALDPSSCQTMVARLYTPDLVRQRRMISAAQEAEERRVKGEYDATRDLHLANFWHRQQEVKRTLRPFAKNTGQRAATPGTVFRTTVNETSISGTSSANRSTILPPMSKPSSTAGSPTAKHAPVYGAEEQRAPTPAKTPEVQPPSPASSRSSDTYHSPETSIVAASPQGSLAAGSPSKRSHRSAEYSSDYDDDFSSSTSEATSPVKAAADEGAPPPAAAPAPAPAKAEDTAPNANGEASSRALVVTQESDAEAVGGKTDLSSPPTVDPLTRDDVATLVMMVCPDPNFAASVRRLTIHDGFDLTWINKPKQTQPKLVTILDVPAAQRASSSSPTTDAGNDGAATTAVAAGDPQLDGEKPKSRSTTPAAKPTSTSTAAVNSDINSPRTALLLLRNGVAPCELWPVSFHDHAQAELKRGSSKTVIRHRYELREATRMATLETLRRQYAELCAQAPLADVLVQLRKVAKKRAERADPLKDGSRLMNDSDDDDVNTTIASTSGQSRNNRSTASGGRGGSLSLSSKHEEKRLRLEKQFSTAMELERKRTNKMVSRHEKELRTDETLREKQAREARERAERGQQRDAHLRETVTAAEQLLLTRTEKIEKELMYQEQRSERAKQRAHVEHLAKQEYLLATREERLRLVAAHERREEYEKLQVLQAAQLRQDAINDMLMRREMERQRILEERRQQQLRLEEAALKLQTDLLQLKRKQLQPAASAPVRAKSALH